MKKKKWKNWSGSVTARPELICYPCSPEQMRAIVIRAEKEYKNIRVVGSGHSFTPLAATDGLLMSLDNYQGITGIQKYPERDPIVSVKAGTKLSILNDLLFERGYALENLGDVAYQALAGAICTGTHGTGKFLGNLSTQVVYLKFINGLGEMIECSLDNNPELFKAAQVSLGALGIIFEVGLRVLPAYKLKLEVEKRTLDDVVFFSKDHHLAHNRHFEFFWFPYTEKVLSKKMNISEGAISKTKLQPFKEIVLENGVFWLLSEACRWLPWSFVCKWVSQLSAAAAPTEQRIDWSHRIFATKRLVKFVEMEYAVPFSNLHETIASINRYLYSKQPRVNFPIECRVVDSDDIWLSPSYGDRRAYIAVHMYKGMPYTEYFENLEKIFLENKGRPHWGKMHSLNSEVLSKKYPKWNDFLRIREQMDPKGIFLNLHLKKILGV